jgi:hypothetical protein
MGPVAGDDARCEMGRDLSPRQRRVLLDVYDALVAAGPGRRRRA